MGLTVAGVDGYTRTRRRESGPDIWLSSWVEDGLDARNPVGLPDIALSVPGTEETAEVKQWGNETTGAVNENVEGVANGLACRIASPQPVPRHSKLSNEVLLPEPVDEEKESMRATERAFREKVTSELPHNFQGS